MSFKYRKPIIIDDAISQVHLNKVEEYSTWMKYGWKSNGQKEYDFGHWQRNIVGPSNKLNLDQALYPSFETDHPVMADIFDGLVNVLGPRALLRSYIKTYTYGTDGYVHTDMGNYRFDIEGEAPSDGFETAILYLNKQWKADWFGATLLYDEQEDIEIGVLPKYNRLFIFDGRQPHSSSPLSRCCPVGKQILVFNTMPHETVDKGFLFLKNNYSNTPHSPTSGGTVFEHLLGTFEILDSMPCTTETAVAGLWHAVYGTAFFNQKALDRSFVISMIGAEAESLVYKFSQYGKDRFDQIYNGSDVNMKYLEYANFVEVSPKLPGRVSESLIENVNQKITALKAQLDELR